MPQQGPVYLDPSGNPLGAKPQYLSPTGQPLTGGPPPPVFEGLPTLDTQFKATGGNNMLGNLGFGIAKGMTSTGLNLAKVVGLVPKDTKLEDLGVEHAQGIMQSLGFAGEQLYEYRIPTQVAGKAVGAAHAGVDIWKNASTFLQNSPRVVSAIKGAIKLGFEGEAAYGWARAQGYSPEEAGHIRDTTAALVPIVGWASNRIAPRILSSLIKPPQAELQFGKNAVEGILEEGHWATDMGKWNNAAGKFESGLGKKVEDSISYYKAKAQDILADPAISGNKANAASLITAATQNAIDHQQYMQAGMHVPTLDKWRTGLVQGVMQKYGTLDLNPVQMQELKEEIGRSVKWVESDVENMTLDALKKDVYRSVDGWLDTIAPSTKDYNRRMANLISARKSIINRVGGIDNSSILRVPEGTLQKTLGAKIIRALNPDYTPPRLGGSKPAAAGTAPPTSGSWTFQPGPVGGPAKPIAPTAVYARPMNQPAQLTPAPQGQLGGVTVGSLGSNFHPEAPAPRFELYPSGLPPAMNPTVGPISAPPSPEVGSRQVPGPPERLGLPPAPTNLGPTGESQFTHRPVPLKKVPKTKVPLATPKAPVAPAPKAPMSEADQQTVDAGKAYLEQLKKEMAATRAEEATKAAKPTAEGKKPEPPPTPAQKAAKQIVKSEQAAKAAPKLVTTPPKLKLEKPLPSPKDFGFTDLPQGPVTQIKKIVSTAANEQEAIAGILNAKFTPETTLGKYAASLLAHKFGVK